MASQPAADMDFKALPKIEVSHLFCTYTVETSLLAPISRRTLHDIWVRKKQAGETDLADPLVEMPDGKHDYNLTTFFPLFSSYIYNLITDPVTLHAATLSVLQDFHADGVTYLELRTTPRSLPSPTPQPPSAYVSTILSAIAAFEAAHPGPGAMRTRLILSVDRRHTPAQARETVRLASRFREQGVVGVDLCGDPAARVHGVPGQDDVSIFRAPSPRPRSSG
ncbi:adenosine deaminase-like protein A [Colletotrichum liriopes]|uniref:Adenosine deaminase-like protein A n=1 Tax=Colletotrichum liriopes TaxID=708192 RepID=A0AA37LQW0_9PEZI|nr:adenosine deaminase-like protein A [Colletotrichum liriopes]